MRLNWNDCKKILVIRPDNMGDLLMSTPAIRALKQTFGASISVLTSSMAAGVARYIPEIDEILTYDLPWVKLAQQLDDTSFPQVVSLLREKTFDAAVVFTVYSQNPMPCILLAWMAGIPRRLAYCRENPYQLLTHWQPDSEPYSFIRHQVRRDLDLVASIGAFPSNDQLSLNVPPKAWHSCTEKLIAAGVDTSAPWLLLHAGVSERKRAYPETEWIAGARDLVQDLGVQVLFTGSKNEASLTQSLAAATGPGAFSMGGLWTLEEMMAAVQQAPVLISVNTGPVHIAAATGTPVVVLYATSNPQHLPWQAMGKAFFFDIPQEDRSKNEVVRYVQNELQVSCPQPVAALSWVRAVREILEGHQEPMPLLAPLKEPS